PTLILGGEISLTGGTEGAFDLNGIVIAYAPPSPGAPLPAALLHVPSTSQLTHLGLTHSTLVPGWALLPNGDPDPTYFGLPTLLVEPSGIEIIVQKSILGGMRINVEATAKLSDSIMDATDMTAVAYVASIDPIANRPQPGGALTMIGCTVVGKVYSELLTLVSDSIIWAALSAADTAATPPLGAAPLWAVRRQEGCVRFSYLPEGAIVPRRFKCVEQAVGVPQPLFYSLSYGDP